MNSKIRSIGAVLALLVLLTAFSFISARPVQAQEDTRTVSLSFSPSEAKPGDTVTLRLDIEGTYAGSQFAITYDAAQLSYISCEMNDAQASTVNDSTAGLLRVLSFGTADVNLNGAAYLTAQFTVLADTGSEVSVDVTENILCSTDPYADTYPVDLKVSSLKVTDNPSVQTSSSVQSSLASGLSSGAVILQKDSRQLLAAGLDGTVTWSSSDENVASVDENGVVTMVGDGSATITATNGMESETFQVSTQVPVSSGTASFPAENDPGDATFLWWIIGGIGTVLILSAIVVVIIVAKKKR